MQFELFDDWNKLLNFNHHRMIVVKSPQIPIDFRPFISGLPISPYLKGSRPRPSGVYPRRVDITQVFGIFPISVDAWLEIHP